MRETEVKKMRGMAKEILTHSLSFAWSMQGLGMLRLHLSGDCRLHVWDTRFKFPGASPIHDHQQWGLHSTVLSGRLSNVIFRECAYPFGKLFMFQTMRAGYGCVALHDPRDIRLEQESITDYSAGESYEQTPEQIHWTVPENGTVTIMAKSPTADAENARVFWPAGEQWGSAEPRPATKDEVVGMTMHALEKWV